ncbi:MAG: hypothetical protein ACXW5U_13945 [Thermoanaerobaculia bacterium]
MPLPLVALRLVVKSPAIAAAAVALLANFMRLTVLDSRKDDINHANLDAHQ